MLDNPVGQGLLESDISSCLFGFQPLVTKDFIQFCLELFVKRRVLYKIIPAGAICGHNGRWRSNCSQYVTIGTELTNQKWPIFQLPFPPGLSVR